MLNFEILEIEIVSWEWGVEFMQVIVRRELILTFAFWKGVNNVLTESVRKGGTQPHTHCIDNCHQKDFCPYL